MSEFKFDQPLNKSTISQFEIYLISSIPVVLEQEGISGLTNYCDDFRNLCQSILTPTEFAQANIKNDKLGKLDQLIDNILNLKDAIREKIRADNLEVPVDGIQKVVDRMNKAQEELSRFKDIAPDPGDNKIKLIASFQSRYKTLNNNECIELANAAFAEAVEHPNEIPNIVSLLTNSDHPLPPNLAIEQIRPVVDYVRDHNPLVGLVHEAIKTEIEKAGIPLTEESTNNILALHYSKIGKEPSFLIAALGGIVSEDLGGKSLPLKPADIQALDEILGSDFSLSAREKAASYIQTQIGANPEEANQLVGNITSEINKAIEENTGVSNADIINTVSATYSAPVIPTSTPNTNLEPTSDNLSNLIDQVRQAPLSTRQQVLDSALQSLGFTTSPPILDWINNPDLSTPSLVPALQVSLASGSSTLPNPESPANYLAAKLAIEKTLPLKDQPAAIAELNSQVSQGLPIVISSPQANQEYSLIRAQAKTVSPLEHQANSLYQTAKSADSESDARQKITTQLTALGYTPDEVSNTAAEIVQKSRILDLSNASFFIKKTLAENTTLKSGTLQENTPANTKTVSVADNVTLEKQAVALIETAKSGDRIKVVASLRRQGYTEPEANKLAPELIKNPNLESIKHQITLATPVSLDLIAAQSAFQKITDPTNRQAALEKLSILSDKTNIDFPVLAAVLSEVRSPEKDIGQVLLNFTQIKTSAVASVFTHTQPLTLDSSAELLKTFKSAKTPDEAIQKAVVVIANNSGAALDSPVTFAQAAATYTAFKENHPSLPSLQIDPTVINSFKSQTLPEIVRNITEITPGLSPSQRQSLATEIHVSSDPQLAVANFIKSSETRAQQAILVASSIPVIPSPFTHEDKVLFATTAATQSLGLTLDSKTIKTIAEIKSSLTPEKAEAEITKLLDKHPLPTSTTSVEISKKLNISINEHFDSQSQSLSQVVDKVLVMSKVDSDTKQQIVGVLSSRLSIEEKDKKLTQLLSENVTGSNVPKLRSQLVDEAKRFGSPKLFTPNQLSELATIANDKRLTPEQRKTDLATKLQSYGYSASASAHTATQIPTNSKPINMEQIIRSANEQKPNNSLSKIASGDQVLSRQELILNSLQRSGLSIKTAQALVADATVLNTITLGLTASNRQLVLQNLIDINYGSDSSRLPLNMPKIGNTLAFVKNTQLNPEFSNNLLQNYTQFSPIAQKAVDRFFQNDTNFKSALTGLFGSKDLADKFMESGLHKSVYLIADQASKTDKLINGKNDNFDHHFRTSMDLHLKYLEDQGLLNNNDLKQLKLWREKLLNPKTNLESFKNLFQMPLSDYKLNFDKPSRRMVFQVSNKFVGQTFSTAIGQPTSFFKYITDITKFKIKELKGQFETIKFALSHPDLKSFVTKFSPQNFLSLRVAVIGADITSLISAGRASPIYRPLVFALRKFSLTPLGRPVVAVYRKALGWAFAKLGISVASSMATAGLALVIGLAMEAVGWLWKNTLGRIISSKDLEDAAGGMVVGAASLIGGISTAIGTITTAIFTIVATIVTTAVAAMLTPFFITALAIPIVIAFFLFIITNSSYVVPPTGSFIPGQPLPTPPTITGPLPSSCPDIWPIEPANITVGAYSGNNTHAQVEALDISRLGITGDPIVSTHDGIAIRMFTSTSGYQVHVYSTCNIIINGKPETITFLSLYLHLEDDGRAVSGTTITKGQTIGYADNTGTLTTGAHLHYEFRIGAPNQSVPFPGTYPGIPARYPDRPPYMMSPYIPKNVTRPCPYPCGFAVP